LAALVLARIFFFGVYEVEGRSMAPTLEAGESVLVTYRKEGLERYDLVVLQMPNEKKPKVKRIVGMPGESLQLVNGDLVVNGARIPLDVPRPPLVAVFDDSRDLVKEWFRMGSTQMNPWKETEEGWHLGATEVASGAAAGTMFFFAKRLTAGHISGDPEGFSGGAAAADCVLACELRAGPEPAELNFVLREQGDTFRAELRPEEGGAMSARILQRWRGGEELLLAEGELRVSAEDWTSLRFGNVDNTIFLELIAPGAEAQVLLAGPITNHLDPSDRLAKGETYGHRLGFGGAAGTADFRKIRVFRDLHYTGRGMHGTAEPIRLGPREFFVLGDNSPESRDGRDWGPVSDEVILGRPLGVVLPIKSARLLGGGGTSPIVPVGPLR
jgi:type IV secretory pathway protease TraF